VARLLPRLILVFFCIVPSAWSADPLARLVTIYRDNFVMEGEPKEIWSLLPYGESEYP
jgi:hypothetical protein